MLAIEKNVRKYLAVLLENILVSDSSKRPSRKLEKVFFCTPG